MHGYARARHWVTALVVLAGAWLAVVSARPAVSQPTDDKLLVFYDPDANHQAIVRITSLFNEFLSQSSLAWRFQPVHSRSSFEQLVSEDRVGLAIVSSSYLRELGTSAMKPMLVPAADGDPYFQKLLVDTGRGNPNELAGKRVAAAATAATPSGASSAIIGSLKVEGLAVDGAIAIPVSKDIDALLAVNFGQADLALVTPTSIDVLRRINPGAASGLRVVYRTKRTLRPPLCAVRARVASAELDRLKQAILTMHENPAGNQAIKTLGFDRWLAYEEGML